MPIKIKDTVIFDLDGTLLQTYEDLGYSINKVLSQNGLPTNEIINYKGWIGGGLASLVKKSLPDNNLIVDTEFSVLLKQVITVYKDNCMVRSRLYQGIDLLLDYIQQKNYKMCILSNKPDELTKIIVENYFKKWNFEIVLGHKKQFPKKPETVSIFHILKTIKREPENCFFVGDSIIDLMTAKNSNIVSIIGTWGYGNIAEIKENKPDYLVYSPTEVIETIENYISSSNKNKKNN